MANNRMYLMNTRTGNSLAFAKYYPETGWYPIGDDGRLAENMNLFFDQNRGEASMFGDEDYVVVYEADDEPKREIMRSVAKVLFKKETP